MASMPSEVPSLQHLAEQQWAPTIHVSDLGLRITTLLLKLKNKFNSYSLASHLSHSCRLRTLTHFLLYYFIHYFIKCLQ